MPEISYGRFILGLVLAVLAFLQQKGGHLGIAVEGRLVQGRPTHGRLDVDQVGALLGIGQPGNRSFVACFNGLVYLLVN